MQKNNNFFKNNAAWLIKVAIVAVVCIFSAGRITSGQAELKTQIDKKVDRTIYDLEMKSLRTEIKLRLKRIEEKLDYAITSNKNTSGRIGDQ